MTSASNGNGSGGFAHIANSSLRRGSGTVTVSFVLAGLPPSPNRGEGWHWSRKHREDEQWKSDSRRLAISVRNSLVPSGIHFPLEYATVTLTYYIADYKNGNPRRRDLDNLIAGSKGILDGLVGVLIVDDDLEHIELIARGLRSNQNEVNIEVSGAFGK